MVHPADYSSEQLLINPQAITGFHVGDLVRVYHPPSSDQPEGGREALLQVVEGTLVKDAELQSGIRWFSVLDSVADFFELRPRAEVAIEAVAKDNTSKYEVRFITISFKDQYLGSPDMWRLVRTGQMSDNHCTAMNTVLKLGHGVEAHVEKLYNRNKEEMVDRNNKPLAGLITKGTQVAFRSMSATIHVLIQMSAEMWEFSPSGNLYFEKAVNLFLADLWAKYDALRVTHAVTIVLFGRFIYGGARSTSSSVGTRTPKGLPCRDFYRVIADSETPENWSEAFTIRLKQAFATFRDDIQRHCVQADETTAVSSADDAGSDGGTGGRLAYASEGNILEAVNLSLITLAKRFRGRNLTRTGESLIVVSASNGVFEVTHDLNKKTKHRCIDDGIALNLVCLGPAPSHVVPLFIVRDPPVLHRRAYCLLICHSSCTMFLCPTDSERILPAVLPGRLPAAMHKRRSSQESLTAMMGSTVSPGSNMTIHRLRHSTSEELAPLLEDSSKTEPTFRTSPRMGKRAVGDSGAGQGVECIVRWIVLSWFYPERSEQMLPRKLSSSPKFAQCVDDPVDAATVGVHALVKLLSEEEDYGASVPKILTFLGNNSRTDSSTTKGPPIPEPDSPNADSSNRAAAALQSMLEGSPSAVELERRRKIEEKEKSEQEEFLAACKAYDEIVAGNGQVPARTRSANSGTRNDTSRRLLQASPLMGATPKDWDGLGNNQFNLTRGVNTLNRSAGGGGRPPTGTGGFGRNPLRPSQSMISLSGMISGRSPALHGLSGAVAISSVVIPGSVGSGPQRGNRRISPMLLPSNSLGPPSDEFSLGGGSLAAPWLQAQQQPPPPRLKMVASTSVEGFALAAADTSTDSDNSFGGTPPQYDGSRNSSGSSNEFFSSEGNSSSSLSFTAGMNRLASGSFYGGLQGERRVTRRRPNPYRPSEIKKLQEKEKQGENVPAWRRRWANVYTPDAVHSYETADVSAWQRDQGVHWPSLCKPAILPLTTKEKMAAIEADLLHADDGGKYSSHFHMATYSPGTYSSAHELLVELVCQRLLHDFQIITPSTKADTLATTTSWSAEGGSTPRPAWFSPTTSASKKDALPDQNEFLMSKGPYFHRLVASQDRSPSVSITRYVPRNLKYGEPAPYSYEVWHAQERHFDARSQLFEAQDYSKSGLKWDRLDECIAACSIAEDLSRSEESFVTKASAKRFAMVPRSPWDGEAPFGGQNGSQDTFRAPSQDVSRVASSSSELDRVISGASQASTGGTSSSIDAVATAASYTAWQDKTRASFKAFIRAVDELGKIDAEAVAGADSETSTDELPTSHRVDIVIKRSITRPGQHGNAHEWGWATYDRHFHPLKAWRLDVCWVSWAGVKVAEFLQRLASRARAHGFLLLEMPVDGNAVAGDAGSTLSSAPSSFVCATVFGRRIVEHKLMHQPSKYGFRYDRRLPLSMSNHSFKSTGDPASGGGASDQMVSEQLSSSYLDLRSLTPQIPVFAGFRRNEMLDEHRWQLLIAAKQRLSLALVASIRTVSVSPDPLVICVEVPKAESPAHHTLGRMVVKDKLTIHAYDKLLCKIAEALPTAADTKTMKRAREELNDGGVGHARERRLFHESMPLQFLHESGGALIGAGRCGGDSEINRTLSWVDLTTAGTNGGVRVRNTTAATNIHASRAELAKAVEGVNLCVAILGEVVELALQTIVTKETKL